jgi:oxygen-independent coproporphyrinogen III oxidase
MGWTKMNKGLYIHIPFCKKKCSYCNFGSVSLSDGKAKHKDLVDRYMAAIKEEIKSYPPQKIETIYIGGGTPTVLEKEEIPRLLEMCRRHFEIKPGTEITVEANPGILNREKLKMLKKSGANRLSLGVQSFHDRLLKNIGRIHTAGEVLDNFRLARDTGFKNINIDLIFALPGESFKEWQEDLLKATELAPEHLSVYNLSLEEGTELYDLWQAGKLKKASNDLEAIMYEEAINFLTAQGFCHYEIANFARSGRESRHNNIYWKNEEYIGLGAGATSYIDGVRFTNIRNPEVYTAKIIESVKHPNRKQFPPAWCEESEMLNGSKKLGETIMLGLRMLKGIYLTPEIENSFQSQIEELINNNLLEKQGLNLRLTHQGLMLANQVYQQFV